MRQRCSIIRNRSRRGVALMLVLIAVVVGTILATTFLVSQSTTNGISQNLENQRRAKYIAETALRLGVDQVKNDPSWRTGRSNGTWVSSQVFAGGTFTLKGEDGTYNRFTSSVVGDGDLSNNSSDAVTLTATGYYGGASHTCRTTIRTVATGTNMIVYGDDSNNQPRYRVWSNSAWSAAQSATNINSYPKWVVAKPCPSRSEVAAVVQNNAEDVYVQFYNGTTWGTASVITTNVVSGGTRPYDAAYESVSGKLLMVYRLGSDGKVHYRTWNGTTLSADASYTPTTTGDPKWLRLISKPGSNEIVMINLDNNNDISVAVWNGSAWGNGLTVETSAKVAGNQCMDGAYFNGACVVAWAANGVNNFKYRTWDGTSWSAAANGPNLGREPQWIKIASDPNASKAIAGTLDGNDVIQVMTWDGSTWGSPLTVESNAPRHDRRNFDIAFENSTGKAMVMWGRSGQSKCYYRTWNGSAWSSEVTGPTILDKVSVPQLTTGTVSGQILIALIVTNSGSLQTMQWSGSAMSTPVTLNTNTSGSNDLECFMVSSCGTITPAPTDFGNSTIYGTSTKSVASIQIATQVTLSQAGTLSSITGYVDGPPPKQLRYAIYTDSAGEPGTLIAQSANATVSSNSMHWQSIAVPSTTLAAGTYWLAVCFEHSNMDYQNNGTSGGKTRYKNNDAVGNGFLASWGSSNQSLTQTFSIYGTITPSGSSGSSGSSFDTSWQEQP